MNGLTRLSQSSTAWYGVIILAAYVAAARCGVTLPWELAATVTGGYAIKEGAMHFMAKQVRK